MPSADRAAAFRMARRRGGCALVQEHHERLLLRLTPVADGVVGHESVPSFSHRQASNHMSTGEPGFEHTDAI